jgi:hypothetical protein
MDLESELRQAMAEEVAEAAAAPTLVTDVRRRHRRRRTRIRVGVGVAAAAVVAVAVMPGYQSIRSETAGADGTPDGGGKTEAPRSPGRTPATGAPKAPAASGRPTPGTAASGKPSDDSAPAPRPTPSTGTGTGTDGAVGLPEFVTFLPSGLEVESPCATSTERRDRITVCRWRGSAGGVEVRIVRGPSAGSPEALITSPGVPKPTRVRGMRALLLERPGAGTLIAWLDGPGVGVVVTADGSVRDQLMRIATGVRP